MSVPLNWLEPDLNVKTPGEVSNAMQVKHICTDHQFINSTKVKVWLMNINQVT